MVVTNSNNSNSSNSYNNSTSSYNNVHKSSNKSTNNVTEYQPNTNTNNGGMMDAYQKALDMKNEEIN